MNSPEVPRPSRRADSLPTVVEARNSQRHPHLQTTVARDPVSEEVGSDLNDVFGELQQGLQPRKLKRPQIKQPTDCKTSSGHVGWQSIILHSSGVQQHRNLVAASGVSGHVNPAPTTAERFARTPNPGDRRPRHRARGLPKLSAAN
jgi:hypothetical protein